MSEVLTSSRFLSGEQVAALRERGVVVTEKADASKLDLPEPKYGETVLGTLTEDEACLFQDLYNVKEELEGYGRELSASAFTALGQAIRQNKTDDLESTISEEQAKHYFALQQKAEMLHAVLYWGLGERLDAHEYRLGVRSRFRVVRLQRRY